MTAGPGMEEDRSLRVLILEDSTRDAQLVARAMNTNGRGIEVDLALERGRFEELISSSAYDVILADFSMPGFDALAALAMAQAASPFTPFICVSGTIGEETTVELLKQGAADVVLKDKLARLPFAVERAMVEAANRQALRESEERFASLFIEAPLGYQALDEEGRFLDVNTAWLEALGYAREEVVGKRFEEFLAPEFVEAFREHFETFKARGAIDSRFEMIHRNGENRVIAFHGRVGHRPDGSFAQTHCLLTDITESRRAEDALRQSEAKLRALIDALPDLVWLKDLQGAYLSCNPRFERFFGAAEEEIVGKTDYEFVDADLADSFRRNDEAAMATAAPTMNVEEVVFAADGHSEVLETIKAPVSTSDGRLIGVLGVGRDITERRQAQEEVRLHAEQLQRTVKGAVLAMSHMVESRDPYTAGHERRVGELATAIGTEMGMAGRKLDALGLAGVIHDIGKIAVPAEILSKPGRLSEIEFSLIKAHPETGFDILADVDFGAPVAEMVLQHHERLDGSGYPRGLKGEEILPEARILAVADVVEAMSSHRPYRAALGMEVALAEVREHAGVRFDAAVVAACVHLIEDKGFVFTP